MEHQDREAAYRPQAVWLYSDGVYRWIYEKDLRGNRFETNYVLRVIMLVFALSWVVMMGILLAVGADFGGSMMAFGIVTAVCLGGGLLAVGILQMIHIMSAKARGGVEVIAFWMNDDGVRQLHYDDARQAEDVLERMMLFTTNARGTVEIKAGDFGVTMFRDVRRMNVHPKDDLIDLTLKGNYKCRVYVGPEDIEFVRDYIQAHLPTGRS